MRKDKEIVMEIKNALQYPRTILELMAEKDFDKAEISSSKIKDSLKAFDGAVRLLNELAGWN